MGRILLVRHGQTIANVKKIWHGQIDTELTDEGLQQAQKLGGHATQYIANPDRIFASPLQRARITAEHFAAPHNLPVEQHPELMEYHIGDWEGKDYREIIAELDFFNTIIKDPDFAPPGGESQRQAATRFYTKVEELAKQHREENIVIVAHGMVISFALAHWFAEQATDWGQYHCDNTAVCEISLDPHELISFNQTLHL